MKRAPIFFLILSCVLLCKLTFAQTMFNGDLEKIDNSRMLPIGWTYPKALQDLYSFKLDSVVKQEGKYSVCIASTADKVNYASMGFGIPKTYIGHQIELRGYLKMENVKNSAGFWLRIDGTTAFSNMEAKKLHGTAAWTEYSIKLPYDSERATNIAGGIILDGNGKIWFDNVRLFIDGKPIEKAEIKLPSKASLDTTFNHGSGINYSAITQQQIKNLTILGQVWGFIKYHHPAIANGDFNMDAELFRVMPSVIKAQNNMEASTAIEHWVDKFGLPEVCGKCKPFEGNDIAQQPDYGEIFNSSVISPALLNKLTYILNNHNFGKGYYIGMTDGVGNPDFKNELPYKAMIYPDAGYRLLSLFRYWNMVQYFYPYKYVIGRDWNTVLPEYIPQFIEAKDAAGYEVAAMKLIASINDTHANIWSSLNGLENYRGKYAPPFQAKFIEGQLVVTAYYNDTLGIKSKIKIGDVIATINGVSVDALIKKYLPLTAASNYSTQLRDMPRNYLLRGNSAVFNYGVVRDGKMLHITVDGIYFTAINFAKAYNADPNAPGYKLLDGGIAYLYPGKYHNKDLPEIKKMFKDTKGMIIDMRCYPSEFMPFTFVPYIKSGNQPFVKFTQGSVSEPGLFKLTKPLSIKGTADYKGKVIVIVNEESQSQAEYTTMAFQSSPNVTVIGSTTAGADGNVSTIILPGGISTMISGINVLYPDGTETQRKGVKIDVQIKPTVAGIKAGRDEVLEKAKEMILQ